MTDRQPQEPGRAKSQAQITPPIISDIDAEITREVSSTRPWLALGLTFLVAVIVLAMVFWMLFLSNPELDEKKYEFVKDMASYVLGPLFGILGTVVGFYFGSTQ